MVVAFVTAQPVPASPTPCVSLTSTVVGLRRVTVTTSLQLMLHRLWKTRTEPVLRLTAMSLPHAAAGEAAAMAQVASKSARAADGKRGIGLAMRGSLRVPARPYIRGIPDPVPG